MIDPDGEKELPYIEGQDTAYIGLKAAMKLETATPMKIMDSSGKKVWNAEAYNCFSFGFHSSKGDSTDPANIAAIKVGVTKWDNSAQNDVSEKMRLDSNIPNKVGDRVIYYKDTNNNGEWDEGEEIVHVAVVTKVDGGGNTKEVTSKVGEGGITTNHPAAPNYYEGTLRQYLRFDFPMWLPSSPPAGYRGN